MTSPSFSVSARLDRLPPTRSLRGLIIRIALGGFFEFYDLFMTGYIAVGLIANGIFSATTRGLFDVHGFAGFVGAGFAGMFVGTLFFAGISDKHGRRAVFTYSLVCYSLMTLAMSFAHTAEWIDFWRFLAGVGVGVQLITIDAYVTEISPKESRGQNIMLTHVISYCAVPVVALVARLAIPHTILGLAGWRYVALVGALGALIAWFLRRGLPESPRWLENQGREDEAQRVVTALENVVRSELGHELPTPTTCAESTAVPHALCEGGTWRELGSKKYTGRTLLLSTFNFFQAIGIYGFAAWIPVLLVSEGITATKSLSYVMAIAILNPVGPLIGMYFADRVQRKWQIVGLSLLIAACGPLWARQHETLGIITLGGIITLANALFSGAFHAYQAELYPTRIRGQAAGFVYSWSRFSSIFVGFAIAAALKTYGVSGVFVIITTAMLIVALLIGVFGPESNGLGLEELSG